MDEQDRVEKSQEILGNIKEWRRAHPKATFVEIEDEVHKRMMQLEAQVLQEAAQESRSREWGGARSEDQPCCPKCQVPLKARGKHKRTRPRQWRTKRHLAQNVRNMSHLWGEFFSLWM